MFGGDNRLPYSTQEMAFNTLVGLFYRVVLRTNVVKTVRMVYCPFQAAGNQSEAAYGIRITGEGSTYREHQKRRFHYRDCREEMAAGSKAIHMIIHHWRVAEAKRSW